MNRCLRIFTVLLALAASAAMGQDTGTVMHVGITSFRNKSVTLQEWQPTMDYLSSRVPGTRFEVVPLNLPEFEGALQTKKLDFLITNPQHYIAVEARYGVSRIATLVKSENGAMVNQFGGVIFTRADHHGLDDISQARGMRVAATDKTSFAAYLIQYDIFQKAGIDLDTDCDVHYLGFPQDLSVHAVLRGEADIGFARSGLLESMAREGKLDLGQLRVLHRQHSKDFPFLVSSELFPEWPMAAVPHVPIEITNQVAAALMLMPPDSSAARAGRYYRWSSPVEYLSVQQLMQRLHIYPFDKPEVSLRSLLREYAVPLVSVATLLVLAMSLLYWRTLRLNRALIESRSELRMLAQHDPLTGLPNRALLTDRLELLIAQARRNRQQIALCMVDLDGFKPVNDTHGHAMGDKLLCDIAQRLQQVLRESDTVARFGGDEFVLLLASVHGSELLNDVLTRVLDAIRQPCSCCEQVQVSASIGVSILGVDAADEKELMRHADEAMYRAKAAGGNRYLCYRPESGTSAV